jgi:hypothetical protein
MLMGISYFAWVSGGVLLAVLYILMSIRRVGPAEVGLVLKRVSAKKLSEDNAIAFHGEAGYQADLLMPGLRWKAWLLYEVMKFPWVQVPAGEVGVVISQVGAPLPIGAKSAVYKKAFGNFSDLRSFVTGGGQKGVQRPVFPPGTLAPIHPVGFIIITKNQVFGLPISSELRVRAAKAGRLTCDALGLRPDQLDLVRIEPRPVDKNGALRDSVIHCHQETLPDGWADLTTSTRWNKQRPAMVKSSKSFLETKTNFITIIRIFRRSSTMEAASVCSMIRCSMARMR